MKAISRREMIGTTCGVGAMLTLPASQLFAQGYRPQYTPLQLNGRGRAMLDPRVTALDDDEDRLIDDLIVGNVHAERDDLRAIDRDFDGLLRNPGNAVGYQPNPFRQEATVIHDQILVVLGGSLHVRVVLQVVRLIDFFVGHWYPCNDIFEITTCERKIWDAIQARNMVAVDYYATHMRHEMSSVFRYHPSPIDSFGRQANGLVGVLDGFQSMARRGDAIGCRDEFVRFTMATDMVFRRHYAGWCG